MVPLAYISPTSILQPFTVWCANCWLMFQYMYLKLLLQITFSSPFSGFKIVCNFRSKFLFPSNFKYGKTSGSCLGPSTLKGSKASNVTIQGEMEEPKFFAKNGPSGTYSH